MASGETKRKLIMGRNIGLLLACALAAPVVYSGMIRFVRSDAFASLKRSSNEKPSRVGMVIGKADIRHYRGQKLMAKAVARHVEISEDRRQFDLLDVSNGIYNSEKGSIAFEAKKATWNAPLRTLFISNGVHVKNKDMDLRTPQLSFSERTGILEAKKEISGSLSGGKVEAVTLKYNANTGAFTTKNYHWNGVLAANLQDPDQKTPTRWDFKGEDLTTPSKDVFIYTDATATDGEIILKGPKVEWNRKTDVVIGTGRVRYFGPEANIIADKATVYRKEKRIILEGHVTMLVKPESEKDKKVEEVPIPEFQLLDVEKVNVKPAGAPKSEEEKKAIEELRSKDSMKKYPTQMYAEYIEYWYGKGNRHADIKGTPQARQDFSSGLWRHVWTDTAKYDGEANRLTLNSAESLKARMKNAYGDDFIADKYFIVSTKEDDEFQSGKGVHGVGYSTDEPEEKDKKKSGAGDTKTQDKKGGG